MKKRGAKPRGKVAIQWSRNLAYAVGLLVTDGCLSTDGRHIIFVSKDKEQLHNFMQALNIQAAISRTRSGYTGKMTRRIQFGDVLFYRFLLRIGLTPNKTKTIGEILIPPRYFFDFLRGHLDGDGTFYSYWDPRWRSSFMFYTVFISASKKHIGWIRSNIFRKLNIRGHISHGKSNATYQLKYAKADSIKLLRNIYHSPDVRCLSRKRLKIEKALRIIDKTL